ncbi:MAG: polynucleotide adenylyltransferase PcnB [Azospira oryzae]|nr:MAG: polynucleotide adenylyltransferase PcnB [Azospira oryzae]PZP79721.1 MAG: polynucleotide adenylyltransferase PcnB [Azospira oryzae]
MIRKLLRRVFGRAASASTPREPRRIPLQQHGILADQISPCARRVVSTLQQAGYRAFIVGGAVRDLLLGRTPKDFDVATNATPEEVRRLFRRSRIIGRRFRLVHVMCGPETVEVSTFRGGPADDSAAGDSCTDEHGRILQDNVFGTQEEDATRRDFTANALFYDPTSQEIWDYHNGYADLKKGVLRIIGEPEKRYREDPVRMLRAVRLAAKLDLKLDPKTEAPIPRLAPLIQNVPAARVFDEMLKLLMSGHSRQCVLQLRARGLHHGLLPLLDVILEQPLGERFVMLALESTDRRIAADKPVTPSFLFAALLWHEVLATWKTFQEQGEKPIPALFRAMDEVLAVQEERLAIPRRYESMMKEIWALQPRFLQRSGQRPFRLLEHPRFRAAYDFLLLRCESGELPKEVGEWWDAFQRAEPHERQALLIPGEGPRRKRRRRRKSSNATAAPARADATA